MFARHLDSLAQIDAYLWNSLAGAAYPFLRHEFLLALEITGCTRRSTGWQAHHLLVWDSEDENSLLAILPMYLKYNSFGEYVFDWSWADAYNRHGLDYYPKLLSAVPFTPSTGPRLCIATGTDPESIIDFTLATLKADTERLGASGWHLLFPEQAMSDTLAARGCHQRLGCQYQWFNRGYASFDDFLASFSSRKRKNIRKERQRVLEAGITFRHLTGQDICSGDWDAFYGFYENTYLVRGREPYLNPAFFKALGETMPDSLLLVLAMHGEQPIAGALSLLGKDTLYGRYWGAERDYQFLHFETCYYQGIDYCLARGLKRFDSGAQGEHKIQRGFEPVPTWSNHWLAHSGFQAAIESFLGDEERHLKQYISHAGSFLPFKKTD